MARDVGAGAANRQGGRRPQLAGLQVLQIDHLARGVGDRVVRPRGDLVLAAVFRPDMTAAFGRDLKTEARVGNHVDPGGWGGAAGLKDRHVLSPIQVKAARAVEELERGQRRRRRRCCLGRSRNRNRGRAGCGLDRWRRRQSLQLGGKIASVCHKNGARHRDQVFPRTGVKQVRPQGVDRAVGRRVDARGPGTGPRGAHGAFYGDLQVLHIGRGPVVQNDKVNR